MEKRTQKGVLLCGSRFTPAQIAELRARLEAERYEEITGQSADFDVVIFDDPAAELMTLASPVRPRQNRRDERRAQQQHFRAIQREHGRRR